jgi:hypothetical protein
LKRLPGLKDLVPGFTRPIATSLMRAKALLGLWPEDFWQKSSFPMSLPLSGNNTEPENLPNLKLSFIVVPLKLFDFCDPTNSLEIEALISSNCSDKSQNFRRIHL